MSEEKTYNWQEIWTCEDGLEAQLIKNLLELEEIPVKLLNVNSNNIFPDSSIAEVSVLVPGDYSEKALLLIQENFE
jgi:hypothetical protein